MKKKDIFLIVGVLIIIGAFFVINGVIDKKKATSVEIYVDNKLYKKVNINDEQEFQIKDKDGYNLIKVHDHGVEMIEASCPDKVCVHTGFVDKPSKSIVCIPNKVSIKIVTNDKNNSKEDVISQ